jgi:hypothetical protein
MPTERDGGDVMSMYAQLLGAALGRAPSIEEAVTMGEALAELLRCRRRLVTNDPTAGPDWVPAAVADQLAYDVALIRVARRYGVECELRNFAQPGSERRRLELALTSRGLRLDASDEGSRP